MENINFSSVNGHQVYAKKNTAIKANNTWAVNFAFGERPDELWFLIFRKSSIDPKIPKLLATNIKNQI